MERETYHTNCWILFEKHCAGTYNNHVTKKEKAKKNRIHNWSRIYLRKFAATSAAQGPATNLTFFFVVNTRKAIDDRGGAKEE